MIYEHTAAMREVKIVMYQPRWYDVSQAFRTFSNFRNCEGAENRDERRRSSTSEWTTLGNSLHFWFPTNLVPLLRKLIHVLLFGLFHFLLSSGNKSVFDLPRENVALKKRGGLSLEERKKCKQKMMYLAAMYVRLQLTSLQMWPLHCWRQHSG